MIIGDTPAQLGQIETADAIMIDGKVVTRDDYRALAAQAEALRDTCSYWINQAKPAGDCSKSEYNAWLALGHQSNAMTKPPQHHLAELRAEAGRAGYAHGYEQGYQAGRVGASNRGRGESSEYAASIRQEGK